MAHRTQILLAAAGGAAANKELVLRVRLHPRHHAVRVVPAPSTPHCSIMRACMAACKGA